MGGVLETTVIAPQRMRPLGRDNDFMGDVKLLNAVTIAAVGNLIWLGTFAARRCRRKNNMFP